MFTEREMEILTELYQNETMLLSAYDIKEINNLKGKLVFGAIDLDGKLMRLTPVGRDCVREILEDQN